MANLNNFLLDLGYNIISLPKSDIVPLTLLIKEGDHLSSLDCPLEALFKPSTTPKPLKEANISDISGQKTHAFDLKSNVGLLSGLFTTLGLNNSDLKAKAAANNNLKLNFSFENVMEEKIDQLNLDNFLTTAKPLENEFRTYEARLKRSELYVITHVLKSSKLNIELTDDMGRSFDFNASADQLGAGNFNIVRNRNNGYTITQDSGPALAFAFKAVQILYNKRAWFEFWKPEEAGFSINNRISMVFKGKEDFQVVPLSLGDQFANL